SASTTISTDITTGGQLSVTGTSTLLGNVVLGSTTPNNVIAIDPKGYLNFTLQGASSSEGTIYGIDANNNGYIRWEPNQQITVVGNGAYTNFAATSSAGSGYGVTAVGDGALNVATYGSSSDMYFTTAIGANALANSLTSGGWNTAVGYSAGASLINGGNNTIIGAKAFYNATSSKNNTAVGTSALYDVTSGLNNIAIGATAGRGITTGSYNTIIGPVTGLAAGLSNNIIIADGSGNQRINVDAAGDVGFGVTSPASSLQVATSTSNATTSVEFGKSGQNKGSCLVLYDAAGNAVYASVAAGASTFTLSTNSCK
ncbi:MAG: hypothetical protein KGJ35_02270, partial [Patescibacteria group bacterium]|nr:hypothetical protein [Patescibacteria group bacterium]